MTRSAIKDIVRAKMDELHPGEGETIQDAQIEAQLDASAVLLVEVLPSRLAYPVSASPSLDNEVDGLSVDVVCPADFIKIHRLRLEGWTNHVTRLAEDTERIHQEQGYDMLRATVRRPVGVLSSGGAQYHITCYPAKGDGTDSIEDFMYVKRPTAAETLNDNLIELLAWQTAASIYLIAGQVDMSGACTQKLTTLIQSKI